MCVMSTNTNKAMDKHPYFQGVHLSGSPSCGVIFLHMYTVYM